MNKYGVKEKNPEFDCIHINYFTKTENIKTEFRLIYLLLAMMPIDINNYFLQMKLVFNTVQFIFTILLRKMRFRSKK